MSRKGVGAFLFVSVLLGVGALSTKAQSFRVQCPTSTITHPPAPITSVSRSGLIVTVHSPLVAATGDTIIISGVSSAGFNGVFTVATVPSAGTFTYHLKSTTGVPTSASGGTVTDNNSEPPYNGPTQFAAAAAGLPAGTSGMFATPVAGTVNGAIKCQQVSGGDGYSTMADGNQIFMFAFGPLSGLADIAAGKPGTEFPAVFNTAYSPASGAPLMRGDPATTDGAKAGTGTYTPWTPGNTSTNFGVFTWNGAVGLTNDVATLVTISNLVEGAIPAGSSIPGCSANPGNTTVTAWTDAPLGLGVGAQVQITDPVGTATTGYAGTWTISCVATANAMTPDGFSEYAFQYTDTQSGLAANTGNELAGTASSPAVIDGHVDPRQIMDIGPMNGNIPAPLVAFDEDDEMFLTLTNVGMIMRPDLFEQHTIHFHGYPNASSFYDGVPDASVAINIGASFTYYYLAPDAGTYFWHCHITPPEHLQMGMVGQLYVRPRQDRVPATKSLYTYLGYQNGIGLPAGTVADLRTACNPNNDILCSATMPVPTNTVQRPAAGTLCSGAPIAAGFTEGTTPEYIYNDGDGSTCYDVVYPIQMHGFDPNFHFVGMTFNPELFVDMKDKYFLLNGRSYPDTVAPGPQATVSSDGQMHYSQPLPAIINIPLGGKASLRLVNLSVAEYFTLQSLGVPMHEAGFNAKLLRDQGGNNTEFNTNSITLGGGESLDVILDASDDGCSAYLGTGCAKKLYHPGDTYYLYSSNLDMLSNDAENFGGMMTEVHICNSVSSDTFGNTCN